MDSLHGFVGFEIALKSQDLSASMKTNNHE